MRGDPYRAEQRQRARPCVPRWAFRVLLLVMSLTVAAFAATPLANAFWNSFGSPSAGHLVEDSGLTSWNPNVSCSADLVTIRDVLGPAYPTQTVNGSRYQTNSTAGGIPQERALSPPCTITNKTGTVLSSFVQINGVSLYGYGIKTTDCSGWYSKQNGGGRYPNNQTFCTNAGQIITIGTTRGYLRIEIDRDWLGKGYCGVGVPYCNNATLGQYQSNGSISLDFQGFVFWEGPYHWELHPLTGWRLSAPPTPPSAPQNLAATGGNAQVTLTWQAPASDGGCPITNYKIYRGGAPSTETLLTTVGNVLTYTDSAVTNGVTYYYQVSAVNSPGEGAKSNEASATPNTPPPPPTPPSAPQNLAATGGNAQVGLTWQAPGSNGGSPITNYKIYRGTTSGGETLVATIGNQLSYSDGGLTNGVTYYYQVSAVNNVGEGPKSNEASETPTAPATPPGAPQGLVATAGDATVTLTWSAPNSNGGSPITNYRIYRGTSSNGETLKATIGNVLTYTDTSVTNGVTYYYQVSALNNVGEGPRSNEASATPTAPATPPGAPQGLGATAGDATVTLTWSAPNSNGGSPITNYRIYRGTSSNGETLKATIGNVLTYTDTSVTNGVTYYYQVSALNNVGEGPRSNEASATPTAPATPPGAPQGLGATAGDATVTLTWSAPNSNGGSPITNYRIYRGTSYNGETLKATIGNVLTYTDTSVTNGVTYYYQVSAVNAAGEGPRSNEASATPSPPATPPGAPQGLGATAGDATVTLTWSAPNSNGGSPITNYRIYRGTSYNGETLKATIGNVLTYTDTSVTN